MQSQAVITLNDYIEHHADRFVNELCELIRIPSVSTDETYNEATHKAALLTVGLHQKVGKIDLPRHAYSLSSWQDEHHFEDSLALYFYKNFYAVSSTPSFK